MRVNVSLSAAECKIATYIGKARRAADRRRARADQICAPTLTPEETDIQSAAAEIAVAKYLNIYPDLDVSYDLVPRHDLIWGDKKIDVKGTQRGDGNLVIHDLHDDFLYILVCGKMPLFTIRGMIEGYNVRFVGEYTNRYNGYWFVPAKRLKPI